MAKTGGSSLARKRWAWLGYLLTLALLMALIAVYACRPHSASQGSVERFWRYALKPVPYNDYGADLYSSSAMVVMASYGDHFYYTAQADPSHPWRGQMLVGVPRDDVIAHFPVVLDSIIHGPETELSDYRLGLLLDKPVENRTTAIQELAARKEEISSDTHAMFRLINASQVEHLLSHPRKFAARALGDRIDAELMLDDWARRKSRYWLTITFEMLFFALLVGVFWFPLLLPRLRRWRPLLWGSMPVLILLPYMLGYCDFLSTPFEFRQQGVLYPRLLGYYAQYLCSSTYVDRCMLSVCPPVLEFLNQPVAYPELYICKSPGPLIPILLGIVIAAGPYVVCWIRGGGSSGSHWVISGGRLEEKRRGEESEGTESARPIRPGRTDGVADRE